MADLKKNPLPKYKKPAYPNYYTGRSQAATPTKPASGKKTTSRVQ
jgi:hypothetical protein